MQRTVCGELRVEPLSKGLWRIDNLAAPHESMLLRGVEEQGATAPRRLELLTVDWQADGGVVLTLHAGEQSTSLRASTAFLHEPRERLYDSLPLERFTAERARFWRRVFRLVRIPGGRLLLGLLARRSSGRSAHE
ncbi:MAG: hypothetical protein ACLQJ0_24140 [Steroidobacteraceae bacterium]|jgi:hypothetical protein